MIARVDQEAVKKAVSAFMNPVVKELDEYCIRDDEQAAAIVDFAINLHADHRKWKPSRIVRKVVEYFNLKLKADKPLAVNSLTPEKSGQVYPTGLPENKEEE